MQDLSFLIGTNAASPLLMLACLTGRPLGQAVLTCRTAEDRPRDVLTIRLHSVYVSSYQYSSCGPYPDGAPMSDQVSLTFSGIEMECGLGATGPGSGEIALVPVRAAYDHRKTRKS